MSSPTTTPTPTWSYRVDSIIQRIQDVLAPLLAPCLGTIGGSHDDASSVKEKTTTPTTTTTMMMANDNDDDAITSPVEEDSSSTLPTPLPPPIVTPIPFSPIDHFSNRLLRGQLIVTLGERMSAVENR